ncbi:hypothetical protein STRIP9103_00871, partial [Streptomyces ipomoeae 91-03]
MARTTPPRCRSAAGWPTSR